MRWIATFCLAAAVALGACDAAVEQTATPTAADRTDVPTPNESADVDVFRGPWRHEPHAVPENVVEVIVPACEDSAPDAGIDITDLGPVVVDARGEGRVTIILGNDRVAAICEAVIGANGAVTIDEPPSRLAWDSGRPIGDGEVEIVGYVPADTADAPRTVLYGRVGRLSTAVKIGFSDESEVFATTGSEWFAAWWPGATRPVTITAVDLRSVAVGSVEPGEYVEGRAGYATWWVDPTGPGLSPELTTIPTILVERACSGGSTPEGRILEPDIHYGKDAILVTMWVRRQPGGNDCQGNPPFPTAVQLDEPLGERGLLDGSEQPPRDATVPVQ